MKFNNEAEIMKKLNIDSWKKLSKDKVIEFSAMMPDMDKEVIMNRIKQFPEFAKFAFDALNTMQKEYETTATANKQSQEKVHEAYQEARIILEKELNNDNLSQEDREKILKLIMESADKEFEKDSENKRFLDGLFNKGVAGTGALALAAIVFVGGQVIIKQK